MAESEQSVVEKETVVEKEAVTIPDYFLSPNSRDDFVLIVEGQRLHVSKGYLGFLSEVLGAMCFNEGCKEAREGEAEIQEVTLSSVLLFLCWAFDIPQPDSEGTAMTSLRYSIGGGHSTGIVFKDIPELLRIADYWQVDRLKRHCFQAYYAYVRALRPGRPEMGYVHGDKADALEAVKILDWVEADLVKDERKFRYVFNLFRDMEISPQDIQAMQLRPEFRYRLWMKSGDWGRDREWLGGYTEIQGRALASSLIAGIVQDESGQGGTESYIDSRNPRPIQVATSFHSNLPKLKALLGMENGQGIPPQYQKLWSPLPDQIQGNYSADALLHIAYERSDDVDLKDRFVLEYYCSLRPELSGKQSDADAVIQLILFLMIQDGHSTTPYEYLFNTGATSLYGKYDILALATAFPHCYAVTNSDQPPQVSLGLPQTDWGHVLSRGCFVVALMSKDCSTDIDSLIAYCAAFQAAISFHAPALEYYLPRQPHYGARCRSANPLRLDESDLTELSDALAALRLTFDHALLFPQFKEEQRQSLRVSVNLGSLDGDLNMVDDGGDLFTFAGIGALLNSAWREMDAGRRSNWAPYVLEAAKGLVAESQFANLDFIHSAAVA